MNTIRGSAPRSRLTKASAAMAATLMAGGIAATAAAMPARAASLDQASAASAPSNQPLLREGSRGAEVSDWQATLNKVAAAGKPGQAKIAVDGIFGPETKAATQAFQRWAHITADGIVGPQTYTAAAQALG